MKHNHIVRTCRAIVEDVEPKTLPSIPRGTYGVDIEDTGENYQPVDFGPPWGVQTVSNADLVDAAAVLQNAIRSINLKKRPWRNVVRRTLRTFAGPYLVTAVHQFRFHSDEEQKLGGPSWPVEAYLNEKGTKKAALALLEDAIKLTGQRAHGAEQ